MNICRYSYCILRRPLIIFLVIQKFRIIYTIVLRIQKEIKIYTLYNRNLPTSNKKNQQLVEKSHISQVNKAIHPYKYMYIYADTYIM